MSRTWVSDNVLTGLLGCTAMSIASRAIPTSTRSGYCSSSPACGSREVIPISTAPVPTAAIAAVLPESDTSVTLTVTFGYRAVHAAASVRTNGLTVVDAVMFKVTGCAATEEPPQAAAASAVAQSAARIRHPIASMETAFMVHLYRAAATLHAPRPQGCFRRSASF